jgi:uracil-DNA glycosylase
MSSRLEYLRALGVEVWERRRPEAVASDSGLVTRDSSIGKGDSGFGIRDSSEKTTVPLQAERQPLGSGSYESRVTSHESPSSMDWPALEAAVKACTLCDLHRTRTQTVFGVGNRQAQWMVIGEAPGADEDRQGEPFVGRAGQLLNSMLKACGLAREQVFIANILKCRPPQNRDPTPAEAGCCTPYLQRQIELVNPKLILCVGRIAAQNLLNTDTPIGKLRGQVHRLGAAQRPVVVTYHPAYLLRSPGEKRRAWQDLVLAMDTLEKAAVLVS